MKREQLRVGMRIYSPELGFGTIVYINIFGDYTLHYDCHEKGWNLKDSEIYVEEYRRLWRAKQGE